MCVYIDVDFSLCCSTSVVELLQVCLYVHLFTICILICVNFTCRGICDLLHLMWGSPYYIFCLLLIKVLKFCLH